MKPIDPRSLFHLTKTGGRLLGLDVGTKYVGISYSEPDNRTAWPVDVLERSHNDGNITVMAKDFEKLFTHYGITGMVIGHPYYCGALDYRSPIRQYVEVLYKQGPLSKPYAFWDDCYTSKIYAELLKPLKLDPSTTETINDKLAAVAILQGYLDSMNRKKPLGS